MIRTLLLLTILIVPAAHGLELTVSQHGADGAYRTLEAARDAIRELKAGDGLPEGGVTVRITPGTYLLEQAFLLDTQDSGTADAPIAYVADERGTVRLMGGRFVTNFAPVTEEATLDRLNESARGSVYAADLKALGIEDYGEVKGNGLHLYFNGKPMQISRWPNEGFVKIVDVVGGEEIDVRGTKGDRIGRWIYEGDRPSRWLNEPDGWLHGYWFWDWSSDYHPIKSIDPEQQRIEVEEPYHNYGYRKGQWYYALNLLSEIDQPGEWYLDREAGFLYFWPPEPLDEGEAFVSLLPNAIALNNVAYCTFNDLVIEGFRNTAVRATGSDHFRIAGCTIRNSGGGAINVSGGENGEVSGCDIYQMGGGGIVLQGGDRPTLTPANHVAVDNHIYDYGQWFRMYHPGISLSGVGLRAAHNLIHNAPHMAIQFGGNENLIEYNEIHSVCLESNDAGAIYAGRDWSQRGTIIRYNFFHNILGFEDRGCVGVYLDDMFCGTHLYGNVFYKVYRAAFIGGGRDNTFENNLFVDCPRALHIDNRAMNWASFHVDTTMTDRLKDMPYTESPWKDRYPELLTLLEDEPAAPKGNVIARNVFRGEQWDDISSGARPFITLKDNLDNVDPEFASPNAFRERITPRVTDFALEDSSPVFDTGFEPLPLEKMGLLNSPDRASWPVEHEAVVK